jgi:protein-S-isoprenylcysteine O-methyltransferase Ste14
MHDIAAKDAGRFASLRRTKLYDLLAALPLIAWFAFCAARMLPMLVQEIALAKLFIQTDPSVLPVTFVLHLLSNVTILLFFTVMVVLFVIRYVPQASARGLYPRFAALAGTFLSVSIVLLPPREEVSTALYLTSLLLMIGGFAFAIWSALSLGRSISILPEARQLIIRGPYSFMRHPIYLGEMVGVAGVALLYSTPWALLIFVLQCVFQFLRMTNEERILLRVFPEYAAYKERTARLVPGVY